MKRLSPVWLRGSMKPLCATLAPVSLATASYFPANQTVSTFQHCPSPHSTTTARTNPILWKRLPNSARSRRA